MTMAADVVATVSTIAMVFVNVFVMMGVVGVVKMKGTVMGRV